MVGGVEWKEPKQLNSIESVESVMVYYFFSSAVTSEAAAVEADSAALFSTPLALSASAAFFSDDVLLPSLEAVSVLAFFTFL